MAIQDIHAELRAHIARKYKTQKEAAKAWGVSPVFVSKVINGEKRPTKTMLDDAGIERIEPPRVEDRYVRSRGRA